MTRPMLDVPQLEEMVRQLKIRIVKSISKAKGGHAGGSMSSLEIVTTLFFREMRLDPSNPEWADRDRFVLSKGHSCLALYSCLSELGYFPEEELYRPYKIHSPLQAHPELGVCPGVDMSSGALGQGLSVGIGMALAARMRKKDYRVYVVVGDGEAAEGQIWEAAMCAPKYRLDSLVGILDFNKLTLSGDVAEIMPLEPIDERFRAFGWHVISIDGHSIPAIIEALGEARATKGRPTMIVAHTIKGKDISYIQGKWECHSITMPPAEVEKTLRALGCPEDEIAWALE
ncbi:transketolase [Candidatus Sumerlaeota bacterium]|nr:transketolase [Candidatus Sumerlaeota bacterium]